MDKVTNLMGTLTSDQQMAIAGKILIYMIAMFLLLTALVIYIIHTPSNIDPRIESMKVYEQYVNNKPITACAEIMGSDSSGSQCSSDFRLSDFYIASSYKSYLTGDQINDYADLEQIKYVLKGGARLIDLDIFCENMKWDADPIVCNGWEMGNRHMTRSRKGYLKFKDVCHVINQYAFGEEHVQNYRDPLFLTLNLHTMRTKGTLDKVADIIMKEFGYRLKMEFSNQGANVALTPICQLIDKVVIFASGGYEDSNLEEIVSFGWDTTMGLSNENATSGGEQVGTGEDKECSVDLFRRNAYREIKNIHEPNKLKQFNKMGISMVIPSVTSLFGPQNLADMDFKTFKTGKESINQNPSIPWEYGCQFVLMNYQTIDANMAQYMMKFKNQSFILKPAELRYTPILSEDPKDLSKTQVVHEARTDYLGPTIG
jgi:hypothetical protein